MKKIVALIVMPILLLATVPGLTACSQLAGLTKNEQVATYDEKALKTLEDLYGFALDRVLVAGQAGLLTRSSAETLVPLLDNVEAAMNKARKLYADGAAFEASEATAAVLAALAQLTAALKAVGLGS